MLIFVVFAGVLASSNLILYKTDQNNRDLELNLSEFLWKVLQLRYEVMPLLQITQSDPDLSLTYTPELVIDYTIVQLNTLTIIDKLGISADKYLVCDRHYFENRGLTHLYEEPQIEWVHIAESMAAHFGWNAPVIIIENDISLLVNEKLPLDFITLSISQQADESTIAKFVTREVRVTGTHHIVLMAGKTLTNRVLRELAKYQMQVGFSLLSIGSDCLFDVSLYPTGILCTTLPGTESATSSEVDFWYILAALQSKNLDEWSLVNVSQGSRKIIGSITKETVLITDVIIYPGGLITAPGSDPFKIIIGLNNYAESQSINTQRAYSLAIADTPLSSKEFVIEAVLLPICGQFDIDSGYLECYKEAQNVKASALLSSDTTATLVYQVEFMRSTSLILPILNTLMLADNVSATKMYPFFMRLSQSAEYYKVHSVLCFQRLGWLEINACAASIFGDALIKNMYDGIVAGGIVVVTPYEQIKFDPVKSGPEIYNQIAQSIADSSSKIAALLMTPAMSVELLTALYDIGLRANDVAFLTVGVTMGNLDIIAKPAQVPAMNEFRRNFLGSEQASFIGILGETTKLKLETAFGSTTVQDCYNYDSVTQIILASDFAIKRGLDFYNWREMAFAVRSIRFQGCSGVIQQSFEHNNRKDSMLTYIQSRPTENGFVDVPVLLINVVGSQTYTQIAEFIWDDFTSNPPKYYRYSYKECPFPQEHRHPSEGGRRMAMLLNFGLTGLASAGAIVVYMVHYKKSSFQLAKRRILMGTQDRLMYYTMVIDPMWIYALGPSESNLLKETGISKQFEFDFSEGLYFQVLAAAFVIVSLWTATIALVVFYRYRPLAVDIQLAASLFIRVFSFAFIFILSSTFDCNEANSAQYPPYLIDSVMDVDCFETCWVGRHSRFAALSFSVLCILLAVTITVGPSIINKLEGLQIRLNPVYLIVNVPVTMLVISIHKANFPLTLSASLYFGTLFIFWAFSICVKVFDVSSISVIHSSVLCLVFFIALIHTIFQEFGGNIWMLRFVIVAVCLIVRLGVYVLSRRLPGIIIPETKIDTPALFAFAFRPTTDSDAQKVNFRHQDEPMDLKEGL